MPPAARAELQRRTLRVLTAGQIVGASALGSAVTVGAFVVQDALGQETPWAGIAAATLTTGTALMAATLSRVMRGRGRRPGLAGGYVVATAGGLIAALGAERSWLPVFLVGLFLFGAGQAANLLARYAATDLAEPEARGRAMSRIVFASTFGAVFGPVLVGPAEHAGGAWFGFERYTGPWLLSALFFAGAAVNTAARLRPDPLVVAGGTSAATDVRRERGVAETLRRVVADPTARLALLSMVISQATMVAVMAMTPVHLKLHGHEGVSQYVVSLHIAGMYAFSPLIGRFADRRGRTAAIEVAGALLVAATLLAAVSGDIEQLLFPSLWVLGLGWNFGLIGGSSLLLDRVAPAERVTVQGTADLTMSLCGGVAGFASGFVRRAVGYHLLANVAMLAAGVLLVAALSTRRRGRGAVAPLPVPAHQ